MTGERVWPVASCGPKDEDHRWTGWTYGYQGTIRTCVVCGAGQAGGFDLPERKEAEARHAE